MSELVTALAFVGAIALFIAVLLLVLLAGEALGEFTERKQREYQYKHRFDKPPTAKCYCVDCIWYCNCICTKHGWSLADDYFCYNATPRNSEVKKDG